jgi:hypothetical protein
MSTACGDSIDSPCIDAGDTSITESLLGCSWGLGTAISDMGAYGGGDSITVGVNAPSIDMPNSFFLSQNYPNPFNAQTTIQYSLPKHSQVTIDIFDILGSKIETLEEGIQQAGDHQATWDADGQSSGIYFYRIKVGNLSDTKKMVLVK